MGDPEDVPPTTEELQSKLREYTAFVEDSLRPQLEELVTAREEAESEITEYGELRSRLVLLQKRPDREPLESLVDLGHRAAYCRAEVENPTVVFVHVGLGFHPELTLDEAVRAVDERMKFLRENVLQTRANRAKSVAGHVEDALRILEELRRKAHELETFQ